MTELLESGMTPDEAKEKKDTYKARLLQRQREREAAEAATTKRKEACDANGVLLRFLHAKQEDFTRAVADLKGTQRVELPALLHAYDFEGQGSLLRLKIDALQHAGSEYDHVATVKSGADHVLLMDALENQRLTEYNELRAMTEYSHIETLATLGPAMSLQGGKGAFIGALTESLQAETAAAWKAYEFAKIAAHEARQKYEQQQAAQLSRGIITDMQTRR
jgi:hypothetical protein